MSMTTIASQCVEENVRKAPDLSWRRCLVWPPPTLNTSVGRWTASDGEGCVEQNPGGLRSPREMTFFFAATNEIERTQLELRAKLVSINVGRSFGFGFGFE